MERREQESEEGWKQHRLALHASVRDAVELLNRTGGEIVLVFGERKLEGIVTDSDIRRGLLRGITLDSPMDGIMNRNFRFASEGEDRDSIIRDMLFRQIRQMPVLNAQGEVVDLVLIKQVLQTSGQIAAPVLIMAGGFGTRLRPLTDSIPKPMMKVGGKPILQILIEQLRQDGFRNILLSVHYRKEAIIDHFGTGEVFGVHIRYVEESERLGTAGAIQLAQAYLKEPFLVINGDILTKVNFRRLLRFHGEHQADLTIASAPYEVHIPYGVVEADHSIIRSIAEKPSIQLLVNAGMYCINPDIIDAIPDRYYDMTQLIELLLERKRSVANFPIHEYWLDIGKIPDYEKANIDYHQLFSSS